MTHDPEGRSYIDSWSHGTKVQSTVQNFLLLANLKYLFSLVNIAIHILFIGRNGSKVHLKVQLYFSH